MSRSPAGRARAFVLATSLAPVVALGGGCASFALGPVGSQAVPTDAKVRLDGLGFVTLATSRATAIAALEQHGYRCHAEAANEWLAPCTAERSGQQPHDVVLQFMSGRLRGVHTPIHVAEREPEHAMLDEYERAQSKVRSAFLERNGAIIVGHLLPGDGTIIEFRYVAGLSSYDAVHRTLSAPPPVSTLTAVR